MPNYEYSFMLPWEAATNEPFAYWVKAQATVWYRRSYLICAVYIAFIYFGQKTMRHRAPIASQSALIGWNVFLSLFSIAGAIRFSPDFFATVHNRGFLHSICVTDYHTYVPGYWTMWFAISKLFELGDTLFLVIRKRPVIFLHWYHHVSVLVFTWHAVSEFTGAGRWFIGMNFLVHGVMYPYYLARSLGLRVPKAVSISITLLQLLQMFIGCYITVTLAYVHWFAGSGHPYGGGGRCQISHTNLTMGVVIYSSYLALFLHFFYNAYIRRGGTAAPPSGRSKKDHNDNKVPAVDAAEFQNGTLSKDKKQHILQQNGRIFHAKNGTVNNRKTKQRKT